MQHMRTTDECIIAPTATAIGVMKHSQDNQVDIALRAHAMCFNALHDDTKTCVFV